MLDMRLVRFFWGAPRTTQVRTVRMQLDDGADNGARFTRALKPMQQTVCARDSVSMRLQPSGATMLVGVPKEIKDNEYRVGLVPSTVRELTAKGHRVLVEHNAGLGAGLPDADYEAAGAEIAPAAEPVFARAEMIVKVKEPLPAERKRLRR